MSFDQVTDFIGRAVNQVGETQAVNMMAPVVFEGSRSYASEIFLGIVIILVIMWYLGKGPFAEKYTEPTEDNKKKSKEPKAIPRTVDKKEDKKEKHEDDEDDSE